MLGQTSCLDRKDPPPSHVFIRLQLMTSQAIYSPCFQSRSSTQYSSFTRTPYKMSPPAENVIQNVHSQVEAEPKAVDKQPTAAPNMTPAQQPAEEADRLRGGCLPCLWWPILVRPPFVFGLWFVSEKRTCRLSAACAAPPALSRPPTRLRLLNYRYGSVSWPLLHSRTVPPFPSPLYVCSSSGFLAQSLPYFLIK